MKKAIVFLLCTVFLLTSVLAAAGESSYVDVEPESWYAACVEDVTARGLMNGVGNQRFNPDGTLTRAMLATILWRMSGCASPQGTCPFTDVRTDFWYTDAITWAAEQDVVVGIGNGLFAPDAFVTREQMAVMFYRFAGKSGIDTTSEENNAVILENASDWAVDAVNWAIDRQFLTQVFRGGLPHGGSGFFYVVGDHAKRAEAAVFLSRFAQEYDASKK